MAKTKTVAKTAKTEKTVKVEKMETVVKAAPKGFFTGPVIILGIIVLIVIIGVVLLLGGNSNSQQQFPSFQRVNSSVPEEFSLIQNSGDISQNLATLSKSGLANVTQFTIMYSGTLQASGSVISISSPISINDYIYGNQHRFEVNVSNVEALGSAEVTYLNITNGTYTCTNFNMSALDSGNYENVLLGSRALTCMRSGTIAGMDIGKLSDFNFSQLSEDGILLKDNEVYQSEYKGIPCTFIAGTVSAQGSGSNGGLFQMCVSDVYYVPLSLSLYATGGSRSTLSLTLNESSISNSSSLSVIDQIPGRMV